MRKEIKMRKEINKCSAILLIAALVLSGVGSLPVNATSASVEDKSTGYTTTTWDFEDAEDADDFSYYKTSYFADDPDNAETDFSVTDGKMTSGQQYGHITSGNSNWWKAHKKALLNDCYGGDIKMLSVEMSPIAKGIMNGCVYMGVNPGSDGRISAEEGKATDGIEIRYTDKGEGDNKHIISVKLYRGNTAYTVVDQTYDSKDHILNGEKYAAAPVKITVTITGDNTFQLDIENMDTGNKLDPISVDLTQKTDGTATGFESSMFRGQVGFGAWSRGACFDNFSITYNPVIATEYDFDNEEQGSSFNFYEYGKTSNSNTYNSDMKISGGCLTSTVVDSLKESNTTGYNRKAILDNNYAAVQSASVDIMPISGADTMRGCMFFNFVGAKNSTNGSGNTAANHIVPDQWYTNITGMVFELTDYKNNNKTISLNVNYHYKGTQYKCAYSWTPEWNDNVAQALTMTVEKVTSNLYLCTVRQKAKPENYVRAVVKLASLISGSNNAETSIPDYEKSGTIGLGTWTIITSNTASPAQFDNLIVDGTAVTIGGLTNSQKALTKYRTLPTGANIVDGKYVLNWTVTANKEDKTSVACVTNTYYGAGDENVTYTYTPNVIDPAMLEVLWQEGPAANGTENYYDVRFMAALNDFAFEDYKRAGFIFATTQDAKMEVGNELCLTRYTTSLYTGLNEGNTSINPNDKYDSVNGSYLKYFITRTIRNIPSGATIYVRTFLELPNGDIVYGDIKAVPVPFTDVQ